MPKYRVRHPRGDYWACDVRRKESNRRADEKRRQDPEYRRKKNAADLARNNADYEHPIWRHTRLMREARRKRALRRERSGDTSPVNPAVAASLDTLLERIPTYEEVRRGKVSG